MAPILVVSCLGPPLVVTAAGEPVRFRTRKHLALLVRLGVEPGKKFTRDYLTDLLWPEAPARLASHSLAQGLSVIRAKVGRSHVLVQRATVALAEGAMDVDVHHLERCDLEVRGAFLEGFDLPAARPFEDWKDEWRAKLQPKVRDCLVRQMDAGRRRGDFATVERHARVLHDLDPLSEDAVRGMIEARAWVADRSNALKVYAAYEARLAEELRAKPSPELQRMATLLREGRRTPGLSAPAAQARAVGEPVARAERRFEPETLIGREREFSVLYDAWLAARRRTPGIVVLTGDPGLGKTTLANAFVSTCQLEGAVVARAQAYDAERELPFAVLAELVRQLASQRAVGGAEPEALSELSRLTPEVRAQFPGVPHPVEWAAEIVPLRLADAFLKTVTAAADESPVVLVVDDVHAADNASAAILHVVARKLPPTRLLLILAARSTELRASGAPAALTSDATIEALRPLDLEPLPDDSATTLVERVREAAGDGDVDLPLERILGAGRGNPLALELLTREWVAQGPESLLRDLEAVNTQPTAALGIPRAIKAVFERQVGRLDTKTRAVLDLAAVLGRRLADLTLYEAVDCSPAEAGEALARLRDEGFVREVHGDIEFRNELIRAQAYYAIPAPARQHLHRRVGELLEGRTGQAQQSAPIETAWHYLRGGDQARALPIGLAGAADALRIGAPAEAEGLLVGLLAHKFDHQTRIHLHQLLARALLDQSKGDRAIPVLESLADDKGLSIRDRAEVARMRASAEYLQNRHWNQRHSEAAEVALRTAYETRDPQLIVPALREHALAGYEAGDEERVRFVRGEIERLLSDPKVAQLASAHFTLGFCHQFFFDAQSASKCFEAAISLLGRSTDLPELAAYLTGQGLCAFYLCRLDVARQAFIDALELARRVGDESRMSRVTANLCTVEGVRGNYEEALAFGALSLRYGTRSLNQPSLFMAYINQIDPCLLTGRTEKALTCLEEARKWVAQDRSWHTQVAFLCEEADAALALGNTSLSLTALANIETIARGREGAVPEMGLLWRLKIFRAAHEQEFEQAFQMAAEAAPTFRERCPMLYFDILAARAWLEKLCHGAWSATTQRELDYFETLDLRGRRALLTAQGFLA